ncbi:MAG: DegT/DnrJ/EryC1/StrS family aminotransferase [Pseudomonadota bacterium]
MTISMIDLKAQHRHLQDEIEPLVLDILRSGHYILGQQVKQFEKAAAQYLGCQYTVGVNSGTDALHLALRALNVQPSDEVILPAFTFAATVEVILYCDAKPVFIDIDPDTFNLDLNQLESLITDKTKVIMPVHLYGNPVDMPRLMALAKAYHLKVIEDAAQAFGASWQGQKAGSFGDIACFSFYPTKNLSCCGDGGLITTQSKEIYEILLSLRNHGSHKRYYHDRLGYCSRLDELQAAILNVKLKHLDAFNQQRHAIAQQYHRYLQDTVTLPSEQPQAVHSYHQYTILHEKRDLIAEHLKKTDIASAIYYPIPLHQQNMFAGAYKHLSLPVTDKVSQQCLSLPIFPEMDEAQIEQVVTQVKQALL